MNINQFTELSIQDFIQKSKDLYIDAAIVNEDGELTHYASGVSGYDYTVHEVDLEDHAIMLEAGLPKTSKVVLTLEIEDEYYYTNDIMFRNALSEMEKSHV